jgi:hypothetical protein
MQYKESSNYEYCMSLETSRDVVSIIIIFPNLLWRFRMGITFV